MGKWWSILFGAVMLACLGLFIIAPFVGWWLPDGVSTHSAGVDDLFYIILVVTGFFFILTEGLLVLFMYVFGSNPGKPGEKPPVAVHPMAEKISRPFKPLIPNEHRLELAWTIIPAVILLYIAFVQVNTWADIKYKARMPKMDEGKVPFQVDVSARQFEWRMRYPSYQRWKSWQANPKLARNFATDPHADDIHVVNELHIWVERGKTDPNEQYPSFIAHLSSLDVQHNLNIPHFRVKQDALPGKIIPVWFRPMKANTVKVGDSWVDGYKYPADGKSAEKPAEDKSYIWEIACAELCGRWHYHMIGKVFVHPSQEDFEAWLKSASEQQNRTKR